MTEENKSKVNDVISNIIRLSKQEPFIVRLASKDELEFLTNEKNSYDKK